MKSECRADRVGADCSSLRAAGTRTDGGSLPGRPFHNRAALIRRWCFGLKPLPLLIGAFFCVVNS